MASPERMTVRVSQVFGTQVSPPPLPPVFSDPPVLSLPPVEVSPPFPPVPVSVPPVDEDPPDSPFEPPVLSMKVSAPSPPDPSLILDPEPLASSAVEKVSPAQPERKEIEMIEISERVEVFIVLSL